MSHYVPLLIVMLAFGGGLSVLNDRLLNSGGGPCDVLAVGRACLLVLAAWLLASNRDSTRG